MLGCTHFIDDLPEILKELPSDITKILYGNEIGKREGINYQINDWSELVKIIQESK